MPKDKFNHEPEEAANQDNLDENMPHEELLTHPEYEEVQQQLNEAEKKANDYWERILRMQADVDNIKRRAERDVESAHRFGLEKFALELLPIVDSLELCLTSVPDGMKSPAKPVLEGVDLTLKLFYNVLGKFNIKQINPVGQAFNPELEQAISMQVDPSHPAGTVLSVMQKGYTLNDRLLRPALVVVSKSEE